MRLLVGTQNTGKIKEYQRLLADAPVEVVGLGDIGLGSLDVEETGTTFTENAILKARAYADASGLATLADDSGLCVDALDGRPGLYSARYGGAGMKSPQQRKKLLGELQDIPDEKRGAEFVCVIAVALPDVEKTTHTREGICRGRIAQAESNGTGGFGYDPIFIPDGQAVTFADIPEDDKNRLSHRGKAAEAIIPVLKALGSSNPDM